MRNISKFEAINLWKSFPLWQRLVWCFIGKNKGLKGCNESNENATRSS
jgi:hypothetical protein